MYVLVGMPLCVCVCVCVCVCAQYYLVIEKNMEVHP